MLLFKDSMQQKNAIIQVIIALIAIAKIVIISLRLIHILTNDLKMNNLNLKKIMLYALVQKADAIKIIVSALKQDKSVLLFVDVQVVRIMTKSRVKNIIIIINVIQ